MTPRFRFYLNVFFAVTNIGLALFTPVDFLSPFNLAIGLFCAYSAYHNRQHA